MKEAEGIFDFPFKTMATNWTRVPVTSLDNLFRCISEQSRHAKLPESQVTLVSQDTSQDESLGEITAGSCAGIVEQVVTSPPAYSGL